MSSLLSLDPVADSVMYPLVAEKCREKLVDTLRTAEMVRNSRVTVV